MNKTWLQKKKHECSQQFSQNLNYTPHGPANPKNIHMYNCSRKNFNTSEGKTDTNSTKFRY